MVCYTKRRHTNSNQEKKLVVIAEPLRSLNSTPEPLDVMSLEAVAALMHL